MGERPVVTRCGWAEGSPELCAYHDAEWGVPLHDDRLLFEAIVLDGAQAGLSWNTILRKREAYRRAFHGFDPAHVAAYTEADFERLMGDAGIVRNRLKVRSAISNAAKFLEVQGEFGSFDRYLWGFVEGETVQNAWTTLAEIPARTALSDTVSKDLQRRGFSFVGSTIIYAMMQAIGMVNDHLVGCFRYNEVRRGA